MVEIIQRGVAPTDRPIEAPCPTCRSILSFFKAEATYVTDARDGDYLVICCPVCKDDVKTAVPRWV